MPWIHLKGICFMLHFVFKLQQKRPYFTFYHKIKLAFLHEKSFFKGIGDSFFILFNLVLTKLQDAFYRF